MKLLLTVCILSLFCITPAFADLFGDLLGNADKIIDAGKKIAPALLKAAEEITPEQEYYIGRSVAANVISQYKVWDNPEATTYINTLVHVLAAYSTRPETFGGYHALILDSDQINAFGAPGGLILVTRGMLRNCSSETTVAAVLAHEIGHVQYQHGLKAIQSSRMAGLGGAILDVTTDNLNYSNSVVKDLTKSFTGALTDITKTLISTGYSRDLETQADQGAVDILKGAGYNPSGLIEMLQQMKKNLKPGGPDFAKTHPTPDQRIQVVSAKIGKPMPVDEDPALTARFHAALDGI